MFVTVFYAIVAGAFTTLAGRYGWLWSKPSGAMYRAGHFLFPAAVCLIAATLFTWATIVTILKG